MVDHQFDRGTVSALSCAHLAGALRAPPPLRGYRMRSAFQTDDPRSSIRRTPKQEVPFVFIALGALMGERRTSARDRRYSASLVLRTSVGQRRRLTASTPGSKYVNTLIVDQTIAEIVPHTREDQASTRLDVGTMPSSAH